MESEYFTTNQIFQVFVYERSLRLYGYGWDLLRVIIPFWRIKTLPWLLAVDERTLISNRKPYLSAAWSISEAAFEFDGTTCRSYRLAAASTGLRVPCGFWMPSLSMRLQLLQYWYASQRILTNIKKLHGSLCTFVLLCMNLANSILIDRFSFQKGTNFEVCWAFLSGTGTLRRLDDLIKGNR